VFCEKNNPDLSQWLQKNRIQEEKRALKTKLSDE
jgi:hypothetical protein